MAISAAYLSIVSVPGDGGTVSESKAFSNIAATTSAFLLKGGKYGVLLRWLDLRDGDVASARAGFHHMAHGADRLRRERICHR
jgi:hypothetical protein